MNKKYYFELIVIICQMAGLGSRVTVWHGQQHLSPDGYDHR